MVLWPMECVKDMAREAFKVKGPTYASPTSLGLILSLYTDGLAALLGGKLAQSLENKSLCPDANTLEQGS